MANLKKLNEMKKSIIIILAAITFVSAQAQQIPLFTQYYNNEFLYNPSQILTSDYSTLSLFHRKQWVNSNDALSTQGLVYQTPLKVDKVGLGVTLLSDKFGIFDRKGASMAYSYQVDLNTEHRLLLGLSAGILSTNYDWNQDISLLNDPRFLQAITDKVTTFDASFGFTYVWQGLQVGMAVPHLLANNFDFTTNKKDLLYFNYRHYVGSASYKFEFDKISVKPLVLVRYQPAVNPLFDGSVVVNYDKKVWAAVGYRYQGALTFGAGVNLHDRLNIGYSYDMNMINANLNQYLGATHEINVKVRFGRSEPTPAKPPVDPTKDTITLEKLQMQINQLKKENKEQQTTIDDHEERIKELENQMVRDSLQKKMEEILDEMKVGSGSVDYRGNELTLTGNSKPIINPGDPEGLFGYKEDGTAISPYEKYDGPVFYDKEATRKVEDPKHPDVVLYDENGNKIDDLSTYTGRVKTVDGKYVKDENGNYVYYDNGTKEEGGTTGGRNGGGNTTGGRNGGGNTGGGNNSGGNTGGSNRADYPDYKPTDLAGEGIRYTAPGNYVVVGSFRSKDYAIKMREDLQDKGYSAGIVYNHYRKWFYVYSYESKDFNETLNELRKEKSGAHKDAWVHVIIE